MAGKGEDRRGRADRGTSVVHAEESLRRMAVGGRPYMLLLAENFGRMYLLLVELESFNVATLKR
jgi:hypothetical protein